MVLAGRGNRTRTHQERKIKTQLEHVALHQKTGIFPVRLTRRKETKLGGDAGSFGRWSKNQSISSEHLLLQLTGRPSQSPTEGRSTGMEGLKREEKV